MRRAPSVGKSADNDLVVDDDPAVSRVHVRLEHLGPAWCITDLGSTNGTTVNGERLFAPRTLFDRDEILVGRTRLVLRSSGRAATSRRRCAVRHRVGGQAAPRPAIQTAAVTMRDLQPTTSDGR